MILQRELSPIGRTLKPHGINGEISAAVDSDIDIDNLRCIVLDIDGIFVPFFLSSFRARGSEAVLLTIDGVTNENEAASLCGLDIFALREDLGDLADEDSEDGFYLSDLVDFTLLDENGVKVGRVTGYDDSTANTLLRVECENGANVFVPIADELVEAIDIENKTISINLPEGLLDL